MHLNQLTPAQIDAVAKECAEIIGPLKFVPGNARFSAFEIEHLPSSNMAVLCTALAKEAKSLSRGRSISYRRELLACDVSRNNVSDEVGYLSNLWYVQLVAQGIEPVNAVVSCEFHRSIGMLVSFSTNGIVLRPE